MTAIKIALMLVIVCVLSYPFITVKKGKLHKFFVASSLRYYSPHNRKNIFFVFLSIVEYIVLFLLFGVFENLAQLISGVPFIGSLISNAIINLNSQIDYIILAIKMVFVNLFVVYIFVIFKALLKKGVINPIFHLGKKKDGKNDPSLFKKKQESEEKTEKKEEESVEDENERNRKRRRIPDFIHTLFEDDGLDSEVKKEKKSETLGNSETEKKREYSRFSKFVLSLFFEGDDFQYARNWVIRTRMILQVFIRLVQILYLFSLIFVLSSVFFELPMKMYDFLINVLYIGAWYIYPIISVIFLQEICNVFDTFEKRRKIEDSEHEEKKEDCKREARLRALLSVLKKRFDSEHSLRYYPELISSEVPPYQCTNIAYASALEYIRKQMEESSGRVVQSYMECLDAIYSDAHVYFAASFYSEFGEYLIAYTYTRLLSGSRMIFVVSDPEKKETLRTFIGDRLMKRTGSSPIATWRVCTANERLDQADVLIASPEDFDHNNIVDQYPGFFEEVCNAVFIDADKIVAMDGYLCPVMATCLKKATDNRVRFIFLSLDLLKGFAARNLPKFFCIDKVLSFSSAKENEAVSYILWNKESKKHRIYNKYGQKVTCLEAIIAEQAFNYGVDGIRLITEAPIEHAERKILALHGVEINNLYKDIVDVNYMIYSDDRCNLSAALYACTRFRGSKRSVVHILSKPYLLREYFMSKASTEDYINRSSFIQPRVTEHVENHKLSLLRIFCEATVEGGLPVEEFILKMRNVIATQKERGDLVSSAFCRNLIASRPVNSLKLTELAAYLVAGLCDNNPFESTPEEEKVYVAGSAGNRAKDFYIIVDPACQDCFALAREKKIAFNRVKEVYQRVFACNKRVELCLNDEVIGLLDTFPSRAHLEYIVGQSIIYKNSEYEIEHIAEDGSAIYLRHENISIKNCLDTILLRHYTFESFGMPEKTGVLNHSKSMIEEIRVDSCRAKFVGTTYGFYSLTSDKQTLDFYHGVEGNPRSEHPNVRCFQNGKVLRVTLSARMKCTDGMRLLLAAVCNEFIRTIFPHAYNCIAICPVLAHPMKFEGEESEDTILNRIKTLYPFLKDPNEQFVETDPTKIQLIFINDCVEDIGALDWFIDPAGRYMQEFLANIYSYLHWLKNRPGNNHYIFFGGEQLPECYDLEGCCELLKDFNLILSDEGEMDIETAGDDLQDDKIEYCSFCHRPMESGRFAFFDKHRFICADCFETVDTTERLDDIYISVREYLSKQYPDMTFGMAKVKFDSVYDLTLDEVLSEFYYRMDFVERTIYVEIDNPVNNVCVSILRGIVSLWQTDNSLANHYAMAQLYFEELCYLRSIGKNETADWIYDALPSDMRVLLDEISDYVNFKDIVLKDDTQTEVEKKTNEASDDMIDESPKSEDKIEEADSEDDKECLEDPKRKVQYNGECRTSFTFMCLKGLEMRREDDWDEDESMFNEDFSNDLYDPNEIPRFWKRYLRGQKLDDGNADEILDDTYTEEDEEDVSADTVENGEVNMPAPNAPISADLTGKNEEDIEPVDDESFSNSVDEKDSQKEEKRRKKKSKKKWWPFGKKKKAVEDSIVSEESDEPTLSDDLVSDAKTNELDNKNDGDENDIGEDRDDSSEIPLDGEEPDGADGEEIPLEPEEKKSRKQKGKNSKNKRRKNLFGKRSAGEMMVPYEKEEKTNPKIRVYNDMVRAAYNYSEKKFSREGVSNDELRQIFYCVMGDYPELFWVNGYSSIDSQDACLRFRCKDASGRLDVKQINKKRQEIRKGAKMFTQGITRRTDPYEALLMIYRRLILALDYDTVGRNAHIDSDTSKDDALRSLYSALVNHKVVCAGYAAAMQYLLQSVGIVCGCVISEDNVTKTECHAFNILKLGKYCYYLDATWGDFSKTDTADYKDVVLYDYFCVPFREFVRLTPEMVPMHYPRKSFYPNLEKFHYTNHEYYRYHNAFLKSYNEEEIIQIFADAALKYNKEEMGRFVVSFRCTDGVLARYINNMLLTKNKIVEILGKAQKIVVKKNKKAAKLFEIHSVSNICNPDTGVVNYLFDLPQGKDNGKK